MRARTTCMVIAAVLLLPGCPLVVGGSAGDCGDPPVLAAAEQMQLATTCVPLVRFEGKNYLISCARVHPSRLGEPLVRKSQHFEWMGARLIRGIPVQDAFILLQADDYDAGCGDKQQVALHPKLPNTVAKTMRSPLPGWERTSTTLPFDCDDPATETAAEPRYSADYLHRWFTEDGCPVRLDVIMKRQGEDACGGPKVADILTGWPPGTTHGKGKTESESFIYVRDPGNVFNDRTTAEAFDADGVLPDDATDTGLRQDEWELWVERRDSRFLYLVGDDQVEKWPLDDSPPNCG